MGEESSNKKIIKLMRLTSQEQMILTYMEQFYAEFKNSEKLKKLLNGKTSIRLVDYFVTNYSKKNRSNIMVSNNSKKSKNNISKDEINTNNGEIKSVTKTNQNYQIFNIHSSYKSQLKAWNKKYFDPFSRGDRIPFFLNDICIITTIGQLNFFKWFISNKIYRYVKQNYDDIEKNMNSNKQIVKKKKKTITPKPYYKRNNYKGLIYSNLQNQVRKSENQQISIKTSKQSESLSCIPNNCFKKSSKIEVRFD